MRQAIKTTNNNNNNNNNNKQQHPVPERQNQSRLTGARDSDWQRCQLGPMQICTSPQTDNHTNIPPLSFHMPDALPATQPTVSKH